MFSTLRSNLPRPRSKSAAISKAIAFSAPVVAATLFAPAKASPPTTFTRTFTGFTEAFAPSEWTRSVTNDGTGSLSSTTMNITATDSNPNGGGAQYTFGPSSKLNSWFDPSWNAQLPNYTTNSNWKFTSGTATFNWSWSFPVGTPGVIYPLQTFVGTSVPNTLWNFSGGDLTNPASYTTSGTNVTLNVTTPDAFGFRMVSSLGGNFFGDATATISNFRFAANYVYVPGPLPAAAAVAGFAWSRKLRRRLKTAGTEA